MNKVQSNKLVFIETQDFIETSLALQNYHKASVAMDDTMVVIHAHDHRHAVMAEELSCYQWPEAKYLKELISVCLMISSVVSVKVFKSVQCVPILIDLLMITTVTIVTP